MSVAAHTPHKLVRSALAPEQYFRWRAGEITRLEAFCDVVFGFAITLLVVSLEVPKNFSELLTALRGFVPFAACFGQVVMIWLYHYKFSRRYGLQDGWTIFLNIVLLFLVLFYVYPLKFVFSALFDEVRGVEAAMLTFHEGSVLMRVYGIGFAAVFGLFALMHWHAYNWRVPLELNEVEVFATRISILESSGLMMIGVVSCIIAFWAPQWAGFTFFLIGPFLAVSGSVMGKKLRLLAGKTQALD
jgi:uncharacterized membrane protein